MKATIVQDLKKILTGSSFPHEESVDLLLSIAESDLQQPSIRSLYSECWFFLIQKASSSPSLHKKILEHCATKIIPYVDQPFLLLDFLTESYQKGGITSLLSLKSLFVLIQKYNLDYPMFYHQLYLLLDENVLHTKYRDELFVQLEVFLSSTHIPAYMIAAFLKRISRLSLSAPAAALMWIIPFVYNTIRQHPVCNILLHRTESVNENLTAESSNDSLDAKDVFEKIKLIDSFDWSADIDKCRALDSSLWELAAVSDHFYFKMALRSKLLMEKSNRSSYKLQEFCSYSVDSFMQTEFTKKLKEPAAFAFSISAAKDKSHDIF